MSFYERLYNVEDAYRLRDKTPIGSFIKFKKFDSYKRSNVTISGVVTAKYPFIFILDNKLSCTWNEYLLGKMI